MADGVRDLEGADEGERHPAHHVHDDRPGDGREPGVVVDDRRTTAQLDQPQRPARAGIAPSATSPAGTQKLPGRRRRTSPGRRPGASTFAREVDLILDRLAASER